MYPRRKKNLADEQAAMRARNGVETIEVVGRKTVSNVQHHQEQHTTILKLAKLWDTSPKKLRREFELETEGVIRFGTDKITMKISESAARRVYARLSR